jgi:hypothetical protein
MGVSNGEDAAAPPRGGRCVRARQLADRREAGEELSDYEARLLDSHLAGCSGCSAYVAALGTGAVQEAVPGGKDDPSRARVRVVEEESRRPEQESESAEPISSEGEPQGQSDRPEHELFEHEHHDPSSVDAMGQDKHRKIVGQTYGPTRRRQLTYYGIFIAFVVLVYIGASFAVSQLDKAPAKPDHPAAPWAQGNAPQDPLGGFSTDVKGGVTHFQ